MAVRSSGHAFLPQATALARQLQLPLGGPADWWLQWGADGLSLVRDGDRRGIRVDWTAGDLCRRCARPGAEAVVKALGGVTHRSLTVLDATAGLGSDTWLLACAGFTVTALERHPVVHALLADGLARAAGLPAAERLTVLRGDARATLQRDTTWDYVYLDPMFPDTGKSAASRKVMQYFQALVGTDACADDLLPLARRRARYRVVVKRHRRAPPLTGEVPALTVTGRRVRYDVYPLRKRPD